MTTRALVVWCPDWPVTAVGMDATDPGAIVASERVLACTAAARASGVHRGQRIRDAQRHCPALARAGRDIDAEGRLFGKVATAVAALTPRVEIVRPGVCAIPARGAARYYGGEQALRTLVQDTVVELGYDCGAGIADGLFAAELAAREAGGVIVPPGESAEFLAPYLLSVLGWPELTELAEPDKLVDLLRRLGIRTLGALAALPAGRVAGRFGAEGTVAHRLARGMEPRPLAPSVPATDLAVHSTFDPPADQADRVIFAARRLADELHSGLAGAGLTCVRLAIEVGFHDDQVVERLWRCGSLSALAVAERVRWQLSDWRVRGEVTWLTLTPDQVVPGTGSQQALWGQTDADEGISRAADRIQSMLGHHAITRPVLTSARGPGEQVIRVPFGDVPLTGTGDGPWPGRVPAPSPSAVPPEPLPATVTDAHGAPVSVSSRCVVSAPPAQVSVAGERPARVVAWTGPWPVSEHWWDPDRVRRRARFQVVTSDDRAYLLVLEGSRWHAEASYG